MKYRRRLSMPLRIARAVSCSLALHGLGWAALREGPLVQVHTVSAPEVLLVAWTEPEPPLRVTEPVVLDEPGWIPLQLDALPEAEPPPVVPPVVEHIFTEPPGEPDEEPPPASPYWDGVRHELARALRWPAGWRTRTNIEVRILAVQDRLLPLAPVPVSDDAIQAAVRRAVERVVRSAERPPEDVVGREMRLTVRFEPET
ncbi:MAG TPA: hypothetical protein PKE12_08125 [Kiritimatiellia bacterium]|nr:hypothetical protein [Kiritimatiellia bacterium]